MWRERERDRERETERERQTDSCVRRVTANNDHLPGLRHLNGSELVSDGCWLFACPHPKARGLMLIDGKGFHF